MPVQSQIQPDPDLKTGMLMAEVCVSDNGVGILSAELDMLLERFQQAGTTPSRRPQGTGLGLAIGKEIVAHQGGE